MAELILLPGSGLTLAVTHHRVREETRECPGSRRGRAGLRRGASCTRLVEDDHGSWFFSLELPRHVGGTRRRIRRGGYASREEAERALGRLQVTGRRVLTVADWLATRAHVRDKTLRGYSAHVRLHLVPAPARHQPPPEKPPAAQAVGGQQAGQQRPGRNRTDSPG